MTVLPVTRAARVPRRDIALPAKFSFLLSRCWPIASASFEWRVSRYLRVANAGPSARANHDEGGSIVFLPLRLRCKLPRHHTSRSRQAMLFALAAVVVAAGPSVADAAQLTLTWTDASGGQAASRIERKTGTTGTYALVAQQPAGVSSYVDTTVAAGTTYCYRVQAFDGIATSDYSNEACASPAVSTFNVTVAKAGTGTGTVTSSPAGISCGSDCVETYAVGSVITLTATAPPGAVFTGWSGPCTGTGACTFTGNGPMALTATFTTTPTTGTPTATLRIRQYGHGAVASSPGDIDCPTTCSATFVPGTVVTLTATPEPGARFANWSVPQCGRKSTCTVTVNSSRIVTVTFHKITAK